MSWEMANTILSDTNFWTALVGFAGLIAGSVLTVSGSLVLHWVSERPKKYLDKKRVAMLRKMLDDDRFPEKWRDLSTLCAVIGASEEETKRLLFLAQARGSEKADGKWGLLKNHPLPGPR